jgi:hypothetical protein
VLPSLTERLHIFLGPQQIDLIKFSRGFKPKEIMRESLPCREAEHDEPLWAPAIECFKNLLLKLEGKPDVMICFSSHFVRYLLIPSQGDMSTEAEEGAYVRFCFSEVYGKQSDHFALKWSGDLFSQPQLASAIDQEFLSAIDQVLELKSMKCAGMQPSLMNSFNLMRSRINPHDQWVVFVESGCILICFIKNGLFLTIRRMKVADQWKNELPKLLTREFHTMGVDIKQGNILICSPDHVELKSLPLSGWKVEIVRLDQISLISGQFFPVGIVEHNDAAA